MRTAEEIFNVPGIVSSELDQFYKDATEAIIKNNPGIEKELKYYSRLPMHLVPYKERSALIRQYRDAIRLDRTLLGLAKNQAPLNTHIGGLVKKDHRQGVSNIWASLRTGMDASADHAFGRLPTDDMGGSLLSNIYSSLNIQFRQRLQLDRAGLIPKDDIPGIPGFKTSTRGLEGAATAASYFTIGLNSIPAQPPPGIPVYEPGKGQLTGKKLLTYDVETAGLAKGQIREVSYAVTGEKPVQLLFNPKEFERGLVNVDGRAGNLNDFLRKKYGLRIPKPTTGDKFAEDMRPFLEAVRGTDFIVGHNITGFDNEQVFVGLSRTNLYKKDKSFRDLVDQAFEKVQKKSIDTLEVVRQMPSLSALQTADEIADFNHSIYSIQNLLLKTNLADEIGIENLYNMMKDTGLHHASIDVEVTNAILRAAETGGLTIKDLGTGLSGKESAMAEFIRRKVVSSSAITPMTNLTSVDQVTDDVLRTLVNTYQDNETSGIMAEPGSKLDQLLRGDATQRQEAYKLLRENKLTPQSIRLTPVEQQIISERDLTRQAMGTDPVSILDRVSARVRINNATKIENIQKLSKEAGIPFAGLSGDERTLAYGISKATANLGILSTAESRVAGVASDTLVSRFGMFGAEQVQYLTQSGRVSLPSGIISSSGVLKRKDFVSLSIVEPTAANSGGAVNVVKSLNDDEVGKLRNFLTDLSGRDDAGIAKVLGYENPEDGAAAVQRFRQAITDGLVERIDSQGVSVAQIHGNRTAIQSITDLFKKHFNVDGQLEDRAMRNIVLPVMSIDTEEGILRTSGAVLNKGLGVDAKRSIRYAVNQTRRVYSEYLRAPAENPGAFRVARTISNVSDNIGSDIVQKIYANVQDKIIPNLGKGLLGVVAVGAGALLLGRHRENERLNETLDFQGWESEATGQYGINRQIQERIDMGYDGYTNLMDPLATASVTNNLNSSRTGHSNYDWARNNQLYGGLL